MNFDRQTRARLTVTVSTDFDPAGASVELGVDGTWYPATWTAAATSAGGKWTRRAQTTAYFAGPDATPAGATVLATGRRRTQTRVTSGGDVIVAASTPIDVT